MNSLRSPSQSFAIPVRRSETVVASGALQKTTWAAGGARKTFHYSQPRCTPPCHIALAVGERLTKSAGWESTGLAGVTMSQRCSLGACRPTMLRWLWVRCSIVCLQASASLQAARGCDAALRMRRWAKNSLAPAACMRGWPGENAP